MQDTAVFEVQNITKRYPGVVANDAVSFSISKGSIHALLGENGAGKSTLVKIMYGLVTPDEGTMEFLSESYRPHKPQDARARGMGMVFQHFSLFDALSVAENIAIGIEGKTADAELKSTITALSKSYGLPLDPEARIGDLSAGERQRVEIIRCLLQNPKLLVMDEPTSVLTPGEVNQLFETLFKLRDEGVSVLYISHKLEEIRALCDEATIMRHGKVVGNCDPREKTARALAEMMVGSKIAKPQARKAAPKDVYFRVENVSTKTDHIFGTNLKDVNLALRQHEILGIAGVAGNGQDELMELLSGELALESGEIWLQNKALSGFSPRARRQVGLITLPEERLGHAAVPDLSLTQNAMLTGEGRENLSQNGWLNWQKTDEFAQRIIENFDVRTPSSDRLAEALSGGNLQKFVVGREFLQNPDVFVVNQPTWGVDAAAAAFIRQALRDLADRGAAVIVISQDLDEIFELSNTVMVLSEGRLSEPLPIEETDLQTIGQLMGGV